MPRLVQSVAADKTTVPTEAGRRRVVWYVSITDFPRGLGSTTRARSMCQALTQAGCQVRLLIPYAIGHAQNDQPAGVEEGVSWEYLNLSTRRPRGAALVVAAKIAAAARLVRRLYAARREIRALFLYNASWFDYWPVVIAARHCRVPVVIDFTDEWHDPAVPVSSLGFARYCYQRLSRFAEGIVFHRATAIVVVSRHMERRLADFAGKLIRIPMAFDPARFEESPGEALGSAGEPVIVYAGSLSATEGTDVLLQAFARLRRQFGIAARLWLVGNTAHRETVDDYRRLARELDVEADVTFHPPVDRQRYPGLLRGADVLVIPRPTTIASQAGFSYKLGEYLATGVPVVTTRFGDIEEYFVAGRDCLMADPGNPAALAEALQWVLSHAAEARAMAAVGQRRVRDVFGVEQVALEFKALLDRADAGSIRPAPASASSRDGRG